LGRSLADLLLHRIREIQGVHERAVRRVGLWNAYYDIPSFQQTLDDDLKLLASADLGSYGAAVGRVITFFFKLLPSVFQPAKLSGTIHGYGNRMLVQLALENRRRSVHGTNSVTVFQAECAADQPEQQPQMVEELAYAVYLELAQTDLYRSWKSFREYVKGLAHYVSWIEVTNQPDYLAAKEAYQRALMLEPTSPVSAYNLAVLEYFQYQPATNEAAIEYFRRALRSPDRKLKAHSHAGLCNALTMRWHRFKQGGRAGLDEARAHGRQAIELLPDSDVTNKAYAFASHQLSEFAGLDEALAKKCRADAIEHYEIAMRINPRDHLARNNLGNLHLERGKRVPAGAERTRSFERAIELCREATEIQPSTHFAYDNMGNAYFELGQLEEAERSYRVALQYMPNYRAAHNDWARLCVHRRDATRSLEVALEHHLLAIAPDPKAPDGGITPEKRAQFCAEFAAQLQADDSSRLARDAALADAVRQLRSAECACARGGGAPAAAGANPASLPATRVPIALEPKDP
jgi:tetratricopeptide (TPR) repeat protein